MSELSNIREDLPTSMTMAAFAGISWYVGIEINISLFMLFKRWSGLYFWSCALGSWGVILQPLFIVLADFGIWSNLSASISMIYLTWLIMVVPQSWVLYSRLHLIMHGEKMLRWIMVVLIFNSIVFSVPTIVIGTLAQATTINPSLPHVNLIWDRVQLVVFFAQELSLSLLYIYQTRKYLRDSSVLFKFSVFASPASTDATSEEERVLCHLIYANILIIALDISLLVIALLGVQYANLFYIQGAFKPCVYGIKLKIEFVILNSLIKSLRAHGSGTYGQSWSQQRQWRRMGHTESSGNETGPQPSGGTGVHLDRMRRGSDQTRFDPDRWY
ncbi:integral membrane protein [Durotheca rogersii]|uniref:uncharacterized protein n=1 Tax=Durotheca rogersii TaxID=419775 RepID=UPI00221E7484|nr:uncharacterized protein GGS23DRAFT_289820 [Durotheca rogersii]KAI5866799.1 integral membrane protein [Durotheca rogersii]